MTALASIRPRTRHLAWLPAALLVGWGVLAACGVTLTPSSHAVSQAGNTTVSATITPHIALGGTCIGSHDGGNLTTSAVNKLTGAGNCTVQFHTTNGNAPGATLKAENARTNAGQATFCTNAPPADCGAAAFANVTDGSAALTDGQFGIQVVSVSDCTTPAWTATNYYSVAVDTSGFGELVCTDAAGPSANQAVYTLSVNARPGPSTPAGDYEGEIAFTAEAS